MQRGSIREDDGMQRIAFLLRLKAGAGAAYDKAHAAVWPEMLVLLKRSGISEYSIFRRDELLVLTMHIEGDFNDMWDQIDRDPVNVRWQEAMAQYFLTDHGARLGERFPMMTEVFYLR
jgi:L-rhamnose mutarotase